MSTPRLHLGFVLALVFCSISQLGWAQNLLPNPSFEVNSGCPTSVAQVALATPWFTPAGHLGSADYMHVCNAGIVGVPGNAFGTQNPYQGDAYIGFALYYQAVPNFREYVQAQFTQPLLAGNTYEISVYYSLGEESTFATDKLQFYFSALPTTWGAGNWNPMNTFVPQASIPTGTFLNDFTNWTKLTASYTAAGGEEYVTIGNFLDDANTPTVAVPTSGIYTTCYIYLDSISLHPINPNPTAAPDTTLCLGACYNLWAAGDSNYTWTILGNTVPFSNADTVLVCPTDTTIYIVQGANSLDTVVVNVLFPPSFDLGPDTSFCQGGSATLDPGVAGLTYLWDPTGAATQTITVSTSGTHILAASNSCGTFRDTVSVTVHPLPNPNLGPDTTLCASTSSILNPGPGFSAYLWSTGAVSTTITVTTAGSYSVTVTDANGCSGSDAIQVSYSQAIGLLVTGSNINCNGGNNGSATALASGSGPFTYLWSNGGLTSTISNLSAGTYSVTVTDANGCRRSDNVTITEPPAMGLTLAPTPESCPGRDDGTVFATVTGGTAPYAFLWSNGQTGSQATGLAPANYSVTVTDIIGCSVVGNTTILPGQGPSANTVGNPSFCEGGGGDTLFVQASGGVGPYYYQWSCHPSLGACGLDSIYDNDPVANPDTSGWYYVQVTDANGCASPLDSIWIDVLPRPIVNAGADHILCGDSAPCQVLTPVITGASGPYSYQWLPGTGLNDPFIANPCARPDSTTIYALVVTGGNGCPSEFTTTDTLATVTVFVNPIPVADPGPDRDICLGDTTVLQGIGHHAGPSYTFQWSPFTGLSSPSAVNPLASPSLTTTYTLVVWSNGCPSYGEEVQVRVHTLPTVDAGPDRELCLGDSILLDAQASGDSTAIYSFVWTPGNEMDGNTLEDPTVWPSSTTMYFVEANSNWNCGSSMDSVLVTLLPSPIADAGPNATVCLGDTFFFEGSYHYTTTLPANPSNVFQNWQPSAGMSDPTSLTPWILPTGSNLYTLTVQTGICSSSDSVLVTVIPGLDLQAAADTNTICRGDSVQLHATVGMTGAIFQWSPVVGLGAPQGSSTFAAPSDSITYAVSASLGGCTSTATVSIAVIPSPETAFTHSQPEGCLPLPVHFQQVASDGVAYTWQFQDGSPVSNVNSPIHVFDRPGSYIVTLIAVGQGGCTSSTSSAPIIVHDTLSAAWHSIPDYPTTLAFPSTEVHFFNDVPGASSYLWDFGDGQWSDVPNPTHQYLELGTHYVKLRITNAEGCTSMRLGGPFTVLAPDLFVPNVFSPNGDGINDVFLVQYTGDQPFNLRIFDRWGVQLYGSNNKMQAWDGLNQNAEAVSDGVYYFQLQIGDRAFTGDISLLR